MDSCRWWDDYPVLFLGLVPAESDYSIQFPGHLIDQSHFRAWFLLESAWSLRQCWPSSSLSSFGNTLASPWSPERDLWVPRCQPYLLFHCHPRLSPSTVLGGQAVWLKESSTPPPLVGKALADSMGNESQFPTGNCTRSYRYQSRLLISWDFHTRQSREFVENGAKKQKTSSEQQFRWQKHVVSERRQRRRARLVKAGRKVTVMQITTHHNSGMQKSISERTMRQTSKWIGYSSRRLKCNKYLIKCSLSV